jgi:multidrug efflux system membrane fusion protein
MKRWMVLLGVASAATAACGRGAGTSAEPPAAVSARIVRVERVTVPQGAELYGTVEAERTAAVSSRVMAPGTAVLVKPGDPVRVGQMLVEIDPATARGQEAQARGGLAQAQAALALAERNYARFQALAAKGSASQLELDVARMQHEQAKGAVAQGEGAVEAAASVARESQVVAPFDGRVAAKLVEVGDLATPGRPLVMVESAAGRRLVLAVPESLLAAGGLKVGSPLSVRIDALPAVGTLKGVVTELDSGADPATHTFTVKVGLPGAAVPTGVSGRAWIASGSRSALAVPRSAVTAMGGLDLVVVRDASGKSSTRAVTVGGSVGEDRIELLSGVSAGEEIVAGLAAVPADGTPVTEARP